MAEISAAILREWLHDGSELALLDVREPGQIGEGHILFSVPLPYSRMELDVDRLVPNRAVRIVLYDDGDDGLASRAAARLAAIGYLNVSTLEGGVTAWSDAGHTLFRGVNVPSKVFGELVEHEAETPRLSADTVAEMRARGENMVIIDGRPVHEYNAMTIPGALPCPNGELALRIDQIAQDPETTIVINCAGRTRSIIGAQTLIDIGVPNPVYALENGTQGWSLSGRKLQFESEGVLATASQGLDARRKAVRELAARYSVQTLDDDALAKWVSDEKRTTYLLDVRTEEERGADSDALQKVLARHQVTHAPGGQLIQATDQWVGVRNARIVVLDNDGIRAPVVASWLTRLGHSAAVAVSGIEALVEISPGAPLPPLSLPDLPCVSAADLAVQLDKNEAHVLDLRSSAAFRKGHVPGSVWGIRPRIAREGGDRVGAERRVVLVAEDPRIARVAAFDLAAAGTRDIALLDGGYAAWVEAGLPVEASADVPPDSERIDFLFFVHDRHSGNAEASRAYLAWETGLVAQLDEQERAVFKIG